MLMNYTPTVKALCREQGLIWLVCGGLALLLWAGGLDTLVARAVYDPHFGDGLTMLAWKLRLWGTWPAGILCAASLGAVAWPGLARRRPVLYRAAVVVVVTALLGAGLFNQILVKNFADRPRPRDEVLLTAEQAVVHDEGFHGNSMPSGHAGMAFVLAAPFFVLRRRHPRAARAVLVGGLAYGGVVGLSRMVLGAHFASDVLVAAAIDLSVAQAANALLERGFHVRPVVVLGAMLAALAAFVLGNHFGNLVLTRQVDGNFRQIHLPCVVQSVPDAAHTGLLTVHVSGYGVPVSNLKLEETGGMVRLQRHHGLYHGLDCTATLAVAPAE